MAMKAKELETDIAHPTLTGVRTVWTEQVTSGLTPSALANILKEAGETTNATDFLKFAEEMEEKDLHYASVLATRKRAVEGIKGIIKPASDDKKDQDLAELVRTHIIEHPEFVEMSFDLLDALAKGFCVMEIEWQTGQMFVPKAYHYRPQRFFKFDEATGRELRLLDEADQQNGLELPLNKFIIHTPRLKSGLPIRGGLARLVAFAFICKAYTVKDWQAFLEVFGMPLRLGKYDSSITKEDMNTLRRAVANIGTDAAAIIPRSMEIEFVQAAKGSTSNAIPFKDSAEWWDRQISKAVLGQTASAEGTPGKLGNEDAQAEVRLDILRSDCRQLSVTINRDLIRPFIDLNFGMQERYPIFELPVIEPEDTAALVDGLSKLVPLGLRVKEGEIRARLGLSEPQKGDQILQASSPTTTQLNNLSLNRKQIDIDDEDDPLLTEALADWKEVMEPMTDQISTAVNSATSFKDLLAKLDEVPGKANLKAMIEQMGDAGFKARAEGDVDDL